MMKLYIVPGTASLAPHILVRELGLPFDLEIVDRATKKTQRGEDYNKLNPKSYVPALRLNNGEILTENAVILQYLADQKPSANFIPAPGTMERYRLKEWLNYITTELHKAVGALFNPATPDTFKETLKTNLSLRMDFVEQQLAKTPYLNGQGISVADIYLFVMVGAFKKLRIDLNPWPHLRSLVDRIGARQKVQEAMSAEQQQMAA